MKLKINLLLFIFVASLQAENIRVKFMIGEVYYKQSAQVTSWQGVQMNTNLQERNIVRTINKSVCELQLPDGSITKILENSMLELRNTAKPKIHGIELFASLGKFYFKVKRAVSSSFTVSSPVSVAAIRGTEFLVIHQGSETKLLVRSGEVELSDPDKRSIVKVRAGQKSSIKSGQMPADPKPLTRDEKRAIDIIAKDSKPTKAEKNKEPASAREVGAVSSPSGSSQVDPVEEDKPESDSGTTPGFRMGAVVGAATIDDQIYSIIGLRPEF